MMAAMAQLAMAKTTNNNHPKKAHNSSLIFAIPSSVVLNSPIPFPQFLPSLSPPRIIPEITTNNGTFRNIPQFFSNRFFSFSPIFSFHPKILLSFSTSFPTENIPNGKHFNCNKNIPNFATMFPVLLLLLSSPLYCTHCTHPSISICQVFFVLKEFFWLQKTRSHLGGDVCDKLDNIVVIDTIQFDRIYSLGSIFSGKLKDVWSALSISPKIHFTSISFFTRPVCCGFDFGRPENQMSQSGCLIHAINLKSTSHKCWVEKIQQQSMAVR